MGKHFLWDPVEDNIVKEIDDAGSAIVDYTTEPYLYGDLVSQHRDGQSSFYHFDGQGNTTSLTDSAANVGDIYAYSAFGEVTQRIGNTHNSFLYIGRHGYYYNDVTDEVSVRQRLLSARRQRWLSVDPLFFAKEHVNGIYGYVENSPLLSSDPSGLITIRPICEAPEHRRKSHGLSCGETARAYYVYELDSDAPCPGYIIQRIDFYCNVLPCDLCPVTPVTSPSITYYEAWEVDPKIDKRHELEHARFKHTDANIATARQGHCGSVFVVGMAKFFCKDPKHPAAKGVGTGELAGKWKIDQDYKSSYLCEVHVGLLSVKEGDPNAPKWFAAAGVEALDTRSSSLDWSCCPCADPDVRPVRGHAKPDPTDKGCIVLDGPIP